MRFAFIGGSLTFFGLRPPTPFRDTSPNCLDSFGIYAGILQALGLLDGLSQIVDISNDGAGRALASAELRKHASNG